MALINQLHCIEACAKDGDSQGSCSPLLFAIDGNIVYTPDQLGRAPRELFLIESILNQISKDYQHAVDLSRVGLVDQIQEGGEQGWPLFGKVGASNFADHIAGRRDNFPLLLLGCRDG